MVSFGRQLGAVLRKNATLHRRRPCASVCELVLPLVFGAAMWGALALMRAVMLPEHGLHNATFYTDFAPEPVPPLAAYSGTAYSPCRAALRAGTPCALAFAPDTPAVRATAARVVAHLRERGGADLAALAPRTTFHADAAAIHAASARGGAPLLAGIVLDAAGTARNYTVLANASLLPADYAPARTPLAFDYADLANTTRYASAGWLAVAAALDAVALEDATAGSPSAIANASGVFVDALQCLAVRLRDARTTRDPTAAAMLGTAAASFAALVPLPLLCTSMLVLAAERRARMREYLLVLGLRRGAHALGWALTFAVPALVALAAIAAPLLGTPVVAAAAAPRVIGAAALLCAATVAAAFLGAALLRSSAALVLAGVLVAYLSAQLFAVVPNDSALAPALCLLAPYAFAVAVFKEVSAYWSPEALAYSDTFAWPFLLAMLAVDTALYAALAWYVSQIRPGEYGVAKPWYFLFTKSYWCPSDGGGGGGRRRRRGHNRDGTAAEDTPIVGSSSSPDQEDEEEDEDSDAEICDVYPASSALGAEEGGHLFEEQDFDDPNSGVVVERLVKRFRAAGAPAVDAVAGVSARFGRGRITALLGHNGAGKTTTLSMLTGMCAPTAGDARVEGVSVVHATDAVRASLGLCPQDSLLYDELTAPEHLRLVGRLKGVPERDLAALVPAALASMSLPASEHRDARVGTFSGGMRRKLALAMALFGHPKAVFLDEPTTGVDIVSRHAIWDALRRYKGDTTIILTTHSMEEADALSDYIYIMAHGRLRCGGTSLFLKQRLGVGYILTIDRADVDDGDGEGAGSEGHHGCDPEAVLALVRQRSPVSAITHQSRVAFSITVPFSHAAAVGPILADLEAQQHALGVAGFGVSLTTLEDVFVRASLDGGGAGGPSGPSASGAMAQDVKPSGSINRTTHGACDPVVATKKMESNYEEEEKEEDDEEAPPASAWQQLRALCWYNWLYARTNVGVLVAATVLPALLALLFLLPSAFAVVTTPAAQAGARLHDLARARAPVEVPYIVTEPLGVAEADLARLLRAAQATAGAHLTLTRYTDMDTLMRATYGAARVRCGLALNALSFAPGTARLDVTVLDSPTVADSSVLCTNLAHTAYLRVMAGDAALALAAQSDAVADGRADAVALPSTLLAVGAALGLVLAGGLVAQRVVAERACRFDAQLRVAGLRPLVGAAASSAALVLLVLPGALLLVAACALPLAGVAVFRSAVVAAFALLLALFAAALAPFNLVFSRLFRRPATCVRGIVLGHLGLAVALAMLRVVLLFAPGSPARDNALLYASVLLLPASALMEGTTAITDLAPPYTLAAAYAAADHRLRNITLTAAASAVLYTLVAVAVELAAAYIRQTPDGPLPVPPTEDADVTAERARVEGLFKDGGVAAGASADGVVLHRVRKIFVKWWRRLFRRCACCRASSKASKGQSDSNDDGGFVAVDNVSFGIRRNDCFGLLGPNGAGKSTLINMLTADLAATNGTVAVAGAPVAGWRRRVLARMALGRCLQTDALMGFLTPRQHVALLDALRRAAPAAAGTAGAVRRDAAAVLERLGVGAYADRAVRTLSGGMCRRVSAALAMLPATRLLVFDEPSTGLDPVTRRTLWAAITAQRDRAGRCLLLTTHSMEEAETLCGTLAIVTRGTLQCVGTVQHLKARYSSGYRVVLEHAPHADPADGAHMLADIVAHSSALGSSDTHDTPPVACVDIAGARRTYAVATPVRLSTLFTELEQQHRAHGVASYVISQASLEDVFVSLVRRDEAVAAQNTP